ncbi:MAG: MarR family winged helix-turn-helix transcriptional regulator [Bacteroidetes bacterium]|nr:MarR family winged helix-turn-helix transcriptional regulator [Bacteroidota bacterium]MBU1680490.1 MarR family winged helix-turn-helix transcriptional regulator [Bacteroidota bacterium]MBU2506260.1 MarR family winged helix-turn-helix transcriptional regulator [Bacteroidota bacterium]
MTDEKKQSTLELWSNLTVAYDVVRKTHVRNMATHSLTAPQFHVLEVLMNSGPIPLKRISEELLVTGANITCVVDNLEKEDLVKRVPSKKDRRVINAELTNKGKEKITQIYPDYTSTLFDSMQVLSDSEKAELNKLLSKLAVR